MVLLLVGLAGIFVVIGLFALSPWFGLVVVTFGIACWLESKGRQRKKRKQDQAIDKDALIKRREALTKKQVVANLSEAEMFKRYGPKA